MLDPELQEIYDRVIVRNKNKYGSKSHVHMTNKRGETKLVLAHEVGKWKPYGWKVKK